METKELKSVVNKAQEAVKDIEDESLKKIAFQKILDSLLNPVRELGSPVNQKNQQNIPQEPSVIDQSKTPKDISELFVIKNPQSHPDIVLTIAYNFHYAGDGDFNVNDLLKAYSRLLIPKPKNPTDIINKNIRKRYLMKVDKQKNSKQAYHITKEGISCVNNDFKGRSKSPYKPRKQRKKEVKKEKDEKFEE